MKKIFYFFVLTISSFFMMIDAKALEYELVYDIENFTIENGKIVFEGWAYITNIQTYGPGSTTRPQNTTIQILANNTLDANIEYNGNKNLDLYNSSCPNTGELDPNARRCMQSYANATCTTNTSTACHHENIGFRATFDINTLKNKFKNVGSVSFTLKVRTNGFGEKSTNIAVYSGNTNIQNGQILDTEGTSISISGISNEAKIIRSIGYVLSDTSNNRIRKTLKWKKRSYPIVAVSNSRCTRFPGLKMYQLSYKESGYDNPVACNGVGCSYGWAMSDWVQVSGQIKLKFEDVQERVNCPSEKRTSNLDLNCDNNVHTFEEVSVEKITLSDSIRQSDSRYGKYDFKADECSGYTPALDIEVKASGCITQTGFMKFNLDRNTTYSGGGFNFTADYNSSTTYQFCEKSGHNTSYPVQLKVTDRYCCWQYDSWCDEYEIDKDGKNTGKCIKWDYDEWEDICSTSKTVEVTEYSYPELWEDVTSTMQTYLENPNHNAKTYSYDSNEVSNSKVEIGSWNSSYDNDSNGDRYNWEPGEEITYELGFELDTACINRRTSKVRYIKSGSCNEDEIDGGNLYYTPLYQPNKSKFPIQSKINDLNVIRDHGSGIHDHKWSVEYECDIECQQKLYDIEEDGSGDGSFNFIYRPITLSNPFPNRQPGSNWQIFYEEMKSNSNSVAKQKMDREEKDKEYSITLTPSNIASIKEFNKGKKYTSLNTISVGGRSSFLNDYGFNIINNKSFNKLGECTDDCWNSSSYYNAG